MIWCACSDTRYVGSAARTIRLRWSEHRHLLRNGKHTCRHLQNAWKKYGEDVFHFIVLENTTPEEAIAAEQRWMDHFRSIKAKLYNTSPVAGSQLGFKQLPETVARVAAKLRGKKRTHEQIEAQKGRMKGVIPHWLFDARIQDWPVLVSPSGEVFPSIRNLNSFCDTHGLDVSTLRKVALGKMRHHRGWRLLKEGEEPAPYTGPLPSKKRTYHLTSPTGEAFTTNNLEVFARDRGLSPGGLHCVIRGEHTHHHGWTGHSEDVPLTPKKPHKVYEVPQRREWPAVQSPDGTVYHFAKLYPFCKEHNLDKGAMQRVIKGTQHAHKGWRRYG